METRTPFWTFRAAAEGKPPALLLYGVIASQSWWGDETTPQQFRGELEALGKVDALDLRINSEGGDVFAATAIYTMLRNHGAAITAYVDGVAASAASLIAMAAQRIVMPANTLMMVHMPWSMGAGNAVELRKLADDLDHVGDAMLETYTARTKRDPAEVRGLLEAETWMTAAQALALGFCDEVQDLTVAASVRSDGSLELNGQAIDLARYAHKPEAIPTPVAATDSSAAPSGGSDSTPAVAEQERRARIIAIAHIGRTQ
jgi:ATP-dependent Clp protease protease subunit